MRQSTAAAEVQYAEFDDQQEEAAACFPRKTTSTYAPKQEIICRAHDKVECPECLKVPSSKHQCQAFVAICQDCGQHHPVIADACQSGKKCQKMPVTEGTVEGKTVNVLRDTGCSTVVVRCSLVPDNKLTGLE